MESGSRLLIRMTDLLLPLLSPFPDKQPAHQKSPHRIHTFSLQAPYTGPPPFREFGDSDPSNRHSPHRHTPPRESGDAEWSRQNTPVRDSPGEEEVTEMQPVNLLSVFAGAADMENKSSVRTPSSVKKWNSAEYLAAAEARFNGGYVSVASRVEAGAR